MTDFTELSAGEGHEARDLNVDIRSLWVVFKTTGLHRNVARIKSWV